MSDDILTALSQCSLGDRTGAAGAHRNGDSDSKMLGDHAGSFVSMLGIYFAGETYPSCTFNESYPYTIASQASQAITVDGALATPAPIPTHCHGVYEDTDITFLSECPSLSTSPASSITDNMPDTPPLAQVSLGLAGVTEEPADGSKYELLEPISNIPNADFFDFLPWGEDIQSLSAPRLSTIELPLEDDIEEAH